MSKSTTMTVRCHCGAEHLLDVGARRDPRGRLIELRGGWEGRSGSTLVAAARRGDLRAFEVERGTLVSWTVDLCAWVERRPARKPDAVHVGTGDGIPEGLRRGAR